MNVNLFNHFRTPFPLLLINFILFSFNCSLLFILINLLTKNLQLASLTTILFIIHPFNTDNMHHITFNIIFIWGIFIQLSFIFFWKSFDREKPSLPIYILSLIFFIIALSCHQLSLTFPLYLANALYCLRKYSIKKIIKNTLPYGILSIIYLIIWKLMVDQSYSNFHKNFFLGKFTFLSFLATFYELCSWLISNLFIPRSIVMIYNKYPASNFVFLKSFLLIGTVMTLLALSFRIWKRNLKSFALNWFLIGFILAIPICIGHISMGLVFEPYWFYFSLIGFFLLFAQVLIKISTLINKKIYFILLAVVFLSFYIETKIQHIFAQNEISYTQHWVRSSPGNLIALDILSQLYINSNKLTISDEFLDNMIMMVNLYAQKGRYEVSVKLLDKIILRKSERLDEKELLQWREYLKNLIK